MDESVNKIRQKMKDPKQEVHNKGETLKLTAKLIQAMDGGSDYRLFLPCPGYITDHNEKVEK